jgi:CheY-like chemotaxis protein
MLLPVGVHLPVSPNRIKRAGDVPADPVRKKIFVLDDDPEMQIFLSNLLNSAGYFPVVIDNGAVELERIAADMPALMIMCVIRYRDSKTRLYKALKEDPVLKRIPVIMLSNIDRKTFFHCQKIKNLTFGRGLPEPEGFLVKPLEADELLRLVRELTAERSAEAL